jgi:phospholipase/lecithinase/hemolysin
MPYTGVYVFGDSLVDSGNALKLANLYRNLTFSDLPDGTPTAALGYYDGRFSNGYTFADLLANWAIGQVSHPTFPFGYVEPWTGTEIAPWMSDPTGVSLNFAYGGAQVRQGDEAGLDLDGQTDAFKDAVDGKAPPGALYIVTMGGNDVRNLAKTGSAPADPASAYAALDKVADQMIHEIGQLITAGARNVMITGIPDVGLIPKYDVDHNGSLDSTEQSRADAATLYSQYLDMLIRTEVVPALRAAGATVTYVPLMDYENGAATVTGGLNAILPTLEALHGLNAGTLSTNLLQHHDLVFFDEIHPTAQVHALFGSYAQSLLANKPWVEILPLRAADVDYSLTASIAVGGEVDKLVIALVADTQYRFDMLGISSLASTGSIADPSVSILGPSGTLVASDADSGAGFDSVVIFNPAVGGNHTLQLSAVGTLTGNYQLHATVIGGAAMEAGQTYTVDNAAVLVLEGAGGVGQDVIMASVSYALAAGSEIEQLITTNARGKAAINLTGNEFDQRIVGNAGANILEGKGGSDTLTGGGGKDVFVLGGNAIDTITDYANGDVVDVGQVLSVAAGVNVVTGGYVRVTTTGLVQVDANGGGDQWVTLSTINGSSAIAIRFLSGGIATTALVNRVIAEGTSIKIASAGDSAGYERSADQGRGSLMEFAAPSGANFEDGGDQIAVIRSWIGDTFNGVAWHVSTGFDLGHDIAVARSAPEAMLPFLVAPPMDEISGFAAMAPHYDAFSLI